jgi:hypothetical protein
VREMIKVKIGKNTELIKTTAEKLRKSIKKQKKTFLEGQKAVEKSYA